MGWLFCLAIMRARARLCLCVYVTRSEFLYFRCCLLQKRQNDLGQLEGAGHVGSHVKGYLMCWVWCAYAQCYQFHRNIYLISLGRWLSFLVARFVFLCHQGNAFQPFHLPSLLSIRLFCKTPGKVHSIWLYFIYAFRSMCILLLHECAGGGECECECECERGPGWLGLTYYFGEQHNEFAKYELCLIRSGHRWPHWKIPIIFAPSQQRQQDPPPLPPPSLPSWEKECFSVLRTKYVLACLLWIQHCNRFVITRTLNGPIQRTLTKRKESQVWFFMGWLLCEGFFHDFWSAWMQTIANANFAVNEV